MKERKKVIIYCKDCGKKREIEINNWKQVKYCVECAYKRRRKNNSAYVKQWRMNKRLVKTNKNEEQQSIPKQDI